MIGLAIPALLVLAAVVLVVVIAIQRSNKPGAEKGDGSDIIAYLVLAVSMIVAGFALAISSDRPGTTESGDYNIFTSTSREVFREARPARATAPMVLCV